VFFARAVARISIPAVVVLGLIFNSAAPVAASAGTEWQAIYRVAKNEIGSPYKHYAKGPYKFDCVGFVWYVYAQNDMKGRIGGYRGVRAYYDWFRERGQVSKDNPRPGDLVIWGDFKHIGLYVGDGKAISALINPYGVKAHPVKGYLNVPFRYYLHTRISR
jgi:cell wall-associated NlpC family hydrolase